MTDRGTVRRMVHTITGNWFSRIYLAVCCGLLVWLWIDSTFVDHPDASFFGVWPMLATFPGNMPPLILVPGSIPGTTYLVIAVGALINAAIIGWCAGALRGRAETHSSAPRPTNRGTVRRVVHTITGNWFSRVYLAVCCGLLVWFWIDSTFVDHPDASFFGVWPMLATFPGNMPLVLLPWNIPSAIYLVIAVGALINAAIIGWCVEAIRNRTKTHSSAPR